MIVLLINIACVIIFLMFLAAAVFVAFHITRYAMNGIEAYAMLLIFFIGFGALLITDLILFLMIDKEQLSRMFFF